MTPTIKLLSAAVLALPLLAIAAPANAQFGPMGGMGMGMGMRGGPMGMGMGGRMGMMPGMGSARYMPLDGGGMSSRRSRVREVYDEPAPRRSRGKPVMVKAPRQAPVQAMRAPVAPAPQQLAAPVVQQQPVQAVQQGPVKQTAPVAQTQAPAAVQAQPQVQAQQEPAATATTVNTVSPATDSALPTRITADTRPHNCTTKLHLKDGTVLLQDFCTLEQAVIKQGEPRSETPVANPQAPAHPAQVARNR